MNTQFGIEFLQKVNEEVTSNGQWDNGTVDNLMVADICAELRECFGTACHTDGRFITLYNSELMCTRCAKDAGDCTCKTSHNYFR